jgi:hypothetical protein
MEPEVASPCLQEPISYLCTEPDESKPQSQILRSTLILSSLLHIGLMSGVLHSGFGSKIVYTFLISLVYPTVNAYLVLLDLIILIIFGERCILWSSSLCNFLQPPVTSSLFGPNILISTQFSNTPNLCSSLKVGWLVSWYQHHGTWHLVICPYLCPPGKCREIHFWGGDAYRADAITPTDKMIVEMMTGQGDLHFNEGSEPR